MSTLARSIFASSATLLFAASSVASALAKPAALAKPPPPPSVALRASEDWTIVQDELGCTLRAEVPGAQKVTAVVLSPKSGTALIGGLRLQLAPDQMPEIFGVALKVGDRQPRATVSEDAHNSVERSATISLSSAELQEVNLGAVVLVAVPGETVAFSSSRAALMLVRLNQCNKQVMEAAFGEQAGNDDPRGTPARSNGLVRIFRFEDYPIESIMNFEQGSVAVLLRIGTDGRVKRCKIVRSSHYPTLDHRTCDVITDRARYAPARDGQGNKVEGVDRAVIRWVMPG